MKRASGVGKRDQFINVRLMGLVVPCIVMALCIAAYIYVPAESHQSAPKLESDDNLREALQWPWADFPEEGLVCEKERVNFILGINAKGDRPAQADFYPVNTALPTWHQVSRTGPLGVENSNRAAQVTAAIALLNRADENLSDAAWRQQVSLLVQSMTTSRGPQEWQVAYHLALLLVQGERYEQAIGLLNTAAGLLPRVHQFPSYEGNARIELEEAYVLTHHALGTTNTILAASMSGRRGDGYRQQAVEHCRAATNEVVKFYTVSRDYMAGHGWAPVEFQKATISSHSIVNNLVVAYLNHRHFHEVIERPDGLPPVYTTDVVFENRRDKILSRTNHKKSTDALARIFKRYYETFYGESESWDLEGRLWALSNMVDFTTFTGGSSPDPWFRYTMARVLAEEVHIPRANEVLNDTKNMTRLGHQDTPLREAYDQLKTVTSILAGHDVHHCSGTTARDLTSVRREYMELYPDERVEEHEPYDLNNTESNLIADQWLFINKWRGLLSNDESVDDNPGRFETFLAEHARLMEISVHGDFYKRWRDEVVAVVAERALTQYYAYKNQNDFLRAEIVANFLRNSKIFSRQQIDASFENSFSYYPWLLRDKMMFVIRVFLALIMLLTVLAGVGRWRAPGLLMVSRHRHDRLTMPDRDVVSQMPPSARAESQ